MKYFLLAFCISALVCVGNIGPVYCGNIQGVATNQTLTLGYAMPWQAGWQFGVGVGSAIVLGIREVEKRQLLPGYKIEWVLMDDWCWSLHGMQVAVDVWSSVEDLDGIIGAACSAVCQPVSLLAAAWGIPMVSYSCTSPRLSDKSIHPTFSRSDGNWMSYGSVCNALADSFGWNRVAILTLTIDLFKLPAEAVQKEMERNGKHVILRVIEPLYMDNILMEMQHQARILYVFGEVPRTTLNILASAKKFGMLTGEYIFIFLELEEVIDHVLSINTKRPSGPFFDAFLQEVIDEFQTPVFDKLPHLPANASIHQVSYYAGRFELLSYSHTWAW